MGEIDDIDMWNAAAERYEAVVTNSSDWRRQHVINPAAASLTASFVASGPVVQLFTPAPRR
jgi:hypothetical protein